MSVKPILISGAGLSSLLLGQSLLRASIPFLIFERDSSMSSRGQGYRLRLSAEGLDAIEAVLGPEKFSKFWDKCGKTGGGGFAQVVATTGEIVKDTPKAEKESQAPPEKPKEPEKKKESLSSRDGKIIGIARGEMRKQFMSGMEPFINWSHNVTSYELTPDGVHAVFADGSKSVEGSMIVGGEGIYSKIAKQVSQGKLKVYDTGARGVHGQVNPPA